MLKSKIMRFECLLLLLGIGCCCNPIISQTTFEEYKRQAEESFQKFRKQKQSEFEAYRDRVNKEYADFMRQAWPEFKAEPAIPVPHSPEPPNPVVAPDEKLTNDSLPFSKVTSLPLILPPPIPLIPIAAPEKPSTPIITVAPIPSTPLAPAELEKPSVPIPTTNPEEPEIPSTPIEPSREPVKPNTPTTQLAEPTLTFDFYGSRCIVPFDKSLKITLRNIDEKSVSKAWTQLAAKESVGLIESCVNLRNRLRLSDWGYLRLVEKLADAAYPGRNDEATLLQMFILTQSGYKVRIGRNGNRLVVLIPCRETVYNYKYVSIKGMKFYIIDQNARISTICIYNQEFPREQMFSLAMRTQPALPIETTPVRSFSSKYGSGISVDIAVNKNLIAFYNEYPLSCHWDINANASLSGDVKSQLYPTLREAIAGKSQSEAANILLRFVQTAFDYMTDDKQFGIERSLFPDETFYYPYSDCEDRAILYTVLVRELLGLDAVLVCYPGHLASAVKFDEDINGDYFNIDGEKYVVCDPTYINANVGMAMPMYKGASAEIVKL